jgi:hypothetical protein
VEDGASRWAPAISGREGGKEWQWLPLPIRPAQQERGSRGGRRGTRTGLGLGLEGEEGGKGGERAWEGSWASRPIRREGRRINIFLFFQIKFSKSFSN